VDLSTPLVSIVVPSYNRSSSLRRLLEALTKQTFPASRFEVVVVDDGSTDGTVEFVRDYQADYGLRVIAQSHAGPAAARNRGAQDAAGQIILFLDDDVAPMASLVQEHVSTHAADAGVVVIGPMLPPGDWPRPVWVRWEEDKLLKQYKAMRDGLWSCTARQFYTGNASLTRDRLLEAGGFDTRFARAEDVELAYRLRDKGARFVFNARAEVWHYASRSFESWCRTPFQYGAYDVVMQRDKGQRTLDEATREFHSRNALNRFVVRMCAGHRRTVRGTVKILGGFALLSGRMGVQAPAKLLLSAIFGVLYWQGVCEELGDRREMWRRIDASAPGQVAPQRG